MMPLEPRCVIRIYRDEPGLFRERGSTGDDRDEPWTTGLHRESIKMFNTSGSHWEGPETTGAEPVTTGKAPSHHRDPYRPRQSYGNAPVVADGAKVDPR
ncbi:hypothetical protein DPMN_013749 [Dreissena polymorpha]|uniref:Uncharacterized protein n=1 Tax=Dreissena polymorpha TaxID=45954 RepID=A0A9D4N4S1_DREPO|nr:hypothetical protein DPMN_013749 [Dreissena polymorpha]